MNRSRGLTIGALVVFVGSALTLIYGAFWTYELQILSIGRSRLPFTKDSMIFMAVASLVAGAWGVATAYGLLNHGEWARISVLVFGWLCLVYCLLPMLYFPMLSLKHFDGMPAHFNLYVLLGGTAFEALFVVVGSGLLHFFSKKSIKNQFTTKPEGAEPQDSVEPRSRRPVSINIVAWYLFLTAFLFTATFSYRMPVSVFSFEIAGWEGRLIKMAYVLIHILAMVGLLELRRWGRNLSIYYFSFLIFDTMAAAWIPGGRPIFEKFLLQAPVSVGLIGHPAEPSTIVTLLVALVFFALPLWVVVTRKKAFVGPV